MAMGDPSGDLWISLGKKQPTPSVSKSDPVKTAMTPGIFSASAKSIESIRPEATVERTKARKSSSPFELSPVNLVCPLNRPSS